MKFLVMKLVCVSVLALTYVKNSLAQVLTIREQKMILGPHGSAESPNIKTDKKQRLLFDAPSFDDDLTKEVIELKEMMSRAFGLRREAKIKDFNAKFDDIILNLMQVRELKKTYKRILDEGGRFKRKIVVGVQLWDITNPIKYIISDDYKKASKKCIEDAFKHWSEKTCIKFEQVQAPPTEPHIVFENRGGCSSKLGRDFNGSDSQSIFFNELSCYPCFGVAVHEIGHAIGFVHEQMRTDRDGFITIDFNNIWPNTQNTLINFNVWLKTAMSTHNVIYHRGSIMHYGQFAFAADFNKPVLISKEPLDQSAMGQRVSLSYYDSKVANIAYCANKCSPRNCQHDGYVNPNNCGKCICPDGFGGDNCETVDPEHSNGCSPSQQSIDVTSTEQCLQSPNYGSDIYPSFKPCNWHLKAPAGEKVEMKFKGLFSVYCTFLDLYCFHWVELKFKTDFGLSGIRFCCFTTPAQTFVSETDLAVVSFKNDFKDDDEVLKNETEGFQLCFKIAGSTPPPTTTIETTTIKTTTIKTTTAGPTAPPTGKRGVCGNVPRPCDECKSHSDCQGTKLCCNTCCVKPKRCNPDVLGGLCEKKGNCKPPFKEISSSKCQQAFRPDGVCCVEQGVVPEVCKTLKCSTFGEWDVKAIPSNRKSNPKQAILLCRSMFKSKKDVDFVIKLKNGDSFKLKKVCVSTNGVKSASIYYQGLASPINIDLSKQCTFTSAGQQRLVKEITLTFIKQSKKMSIFNLEVEVCDVQ